MSSHLSVRNRQPEPPGAESINSIANQESKGPARFQFEVPESVAEEQAPSIQRSTQLDVGGIRRSRSNISASSRQRLIEPEQFSAQNPWNQPSEHNPHVGIPDRKLHKSVSVASLATVKKLLRKNRHVLPRIPPHPEEDTELPTDASQSIYRPKQDDRSNPPDFPSFVTPTEIVLYPQIKHSHFAIVTKPDSPMSMGGSLLHGEASLSVIASRTGDQDLPICIGYLSVDLLGVEFCGKRHHVFQSLAVDLIDQQHSPPAQCIRSPYTSADSYWELVPSTFSIPFQLQLPESPGPPPFTSRHGSIRYILSATAVIRLGSEDAIVRDSTEVLVLETHNPRTSLTNLPLPLNATESFVISREMPFQELILRASLARDVWASGMKVLVDIHIHNNTMKFVNRVTLSLERVMMVYHHSIAQLDQGLYRQSRLPDKIYRKTVASKTIKKSDTAWRGISPHSREIRTWMLNLPTGLATISTGRFFGVRYFLNVSLHLGYVSRTLNAKLPVTILDANSLDITSRNEALSTEGQHRESPVDSKLPPSSGRRFGRIIEQKTPLQNQSRQRRETWAWVADVSPHPSLVPSPLLPSYAIPAKTGKTPSRLRMENSLSSSPAPYIPTRLRPPLKEDHKLLNVKLNNVTSDYPLNTSDTTKATISANQDHAVTNDAATLALTSFRERLQHRSHGAFIGAGLRSLPLDELDREQHRAHGRISLDAYDGNLQNEDALQDAKRNIKQYDNAARRIKRSPLKARKPMPHRRAITRSRDVQSIYGPADRKEGEITANDGDAKTQDAENGWETVENFF